MLSFRSIVSSSLQKTSNKLDSLASQFGRTPFRTLVQTTRFVNKDTAKEFLKNGARSIRTSTSTAYTSARGFARPNLTSQEKLMYTLGITGAVIGIGTVYLYGSSEESSVLEGGLHPVVRSRLNQTYGYVASGLGLTAASAYGLFRTGFAMRIATMSPWVYVPVSLVAMIGSMAVARSTDYNSPMKLPAWALSMGVMGAFLSPVCYAGGPLIAKAAAMTGCMIGSLCAVGASAPSESFLWMAGPLTIGLGVVFGASIGSMFFPASPLLYNLTMYGGVAVFGGLTLLDTQVMIKKAKEYPVYDPIAESYGIYLNSINIFVRMVTILAGGNSRRR